MEIKSKSANQSQPLDIYNILYIIKSPGCRIDDSMDHCLTSTPHCAITLATVSRPVEFPNCFASFREELAPKPGGRCTHLPCPWPDPSPVIYVQYVLVLDSPIYYFENVAEFVSLHNILNPIDELHRTRLARVLFHAVTANRLDAICYDSARHILQSQQIKEGICRPKSKMCYRRIQSCVSQAERQQCQ